MVSVLGGLGQVMPLVGDRRRQPVDQCATSLGGHVPSSGVLRRHPVDVVYAAVGCGSIASGDASSS